MGLEKKIPGARQNQDLDLDPGPDSSPLNAISGAKQTTHSQSP